MWSPCNGPFSDATGLNMLCTVALLKNILIPFDMSFVIYFKKPEVIELRNVYVKKYWGN